MTHFAQYIKRQIFDPSKQSGEELPYIEKQPDDQGFERPAYHTVPTNSGVGSRVAKKDTLWLFSQLKSPWGRLPPSLDARIEVVDISIVEYKKKPRYRFRAGDSSVWFPLLDCTPIIKNMKRLSRKDDSSEPKGLLLNDNMAIGQAIRFMTAIEDPTPLLQGCFSRRVDFISYRLSDGTQSAFQLAQNLLSKGRLVFWDRWSLPRRLAEHGERLSSNALDSTIKRQIEKSQVVWGVESPRYSKPKSYSFYEKRLAVKLDVYRSYRPRKDG